MKGKRSGKAKEGIRGREGRMGRECKGREGNKGMEKGNGRMGVGEGRRIEGKKEREWKNGGLDGKGRREGDEKGMEEE